MWQHFFNKSAFIWFHIPFIFCSSLESSKQTWWPIWLAFIGLVLPTLWSDTKSLRRRAELLYSCQDITWRPVSCLIWLFKSITKNNRDLADIGHFRGPLYLYNLGITWLVNIQKDFLRVWPVFFFVIWIFHFIMTTTILYYVWCCDHRIFYHHLMMIMIIIAFPKVFVLCPYYHIVLFQYKNNYNRWFYHCSSCYHCDDVEQKQ